MKHFETFRTRFAYVGRMLRILWEMDKGYLFLNIADIVVSIPRPFVGMFLVKSSIDMLTNAARFADYLPPVLILLALGLVLEIASSVLAKSAILNCNRITNKMEFMIFAKSIELDYEMLLDKAVMEKRQRALKVNSRGCFNMLAGNFRQIVSGLITIGGILWVISGIEWWIVLVVIAIAAINTIAASAKRNTQYAIDKEMAPGDRKFFYIRGLDSDVGNAKELRVYDMLGGITVMYQNAVNDFYRFIDRIRNLEIREEVLRHVTGFGLNVAMYCYLGFKLLVKRLITVGDFSMYLSAIQTFSGTLQNVVNAYLDISVNGEYIKDYLDYLEIPSRIQKGGRALSGSGPGGPVFTLENVGFTYPYQTAPSVKNVSLTLNGRERLAIVGENGAGKTTLIKLLMRLFEPTEGRILLNGIDIREIDYRQYLGLFSSVFQDYKLFAFRIADNITSFRDGPVDTAKMADSLAKAGLDEKIASLPKGTDTYLYKFYEEDGVELSGGESQKLALARALYKDAPVVILDEPTAALDPRAEYEIYTRFFEMVKDKAAVFITHRLSSTRFCDRIVVLKDGSVVETGTHDALLERGGYYADLFNMQARFYTDNPHEGYF
ncbi:MAG: ABC transporter ATP-binding protein/permease [Treponema sp.]|jgi:ABC-type multidrug transport system fused ATPase/permease subunit|nr:ABC transporter ATP-binding protein/permease [Treponema sp.]